MLVVGGDTGGTLQPIPVFLSTSTVSTAGAEVYDAVNDVFIPTGSMSIARETTNTVTIPLPHAGPGNLTLVAGGSNCYPQAINLSSPIAASPLGAKETGTTVTITTTANHNFAASPNNTVLISGVGVAGYNGTFTITSVPTARTFTYTDVAGLAASGGGTATENPNTGCGATGYQGFQCDALNTAELYNETTKTFSLAGSGSGGHMTTARSGATATLLSDGVSVLLTGGSTGSTFLSETTGPAAGTPTCGPVGQVAQNSAEIYNSVTDTFSPTASIPGCPGPGELPTDATCSGTFSGDALPTVCFSQPVNITGASEAGTTVTITVTAAPTNLVVGGKVNVDNVSNPGYDVTAATVTGPGALGTIITGNTFTYTVTATTLPTLGAGGTAQSAGTAQCGLVDSAAVLLKSGLVPNGVLIAGGDYIQFLALSSQQSFVFVPGGAGAWDPSGPLHVPRELPGSVLLPSGNVLVAGGLTAAAANATRNCTTLPTACTGAGTPDACCTAAGVGASCGPVSLTTNESAETFDPTTFMFTLTSGSSATPGAPGGMNAPRIAGAELFTTGPDAGLAVLVGGASAFSANVTGGPHTFPECSMITNIEQQSQSFVDLFTPATTVFTLDSATNADRGGYGVGVGTFSAAHSGAVPASLVVIGGSCSEGSLASFPIGTAAAGAATGCNGAQYTSDYYELFHQGTGPGTGTWSVGGSGFPAGYSPAAAPASGVLP